MAVVQKLLCEVDQVISHGESVYTVDLRPEHTLPRVRPGQFLHLALDSYDPGSDWPDSRPFSIASSKAQKLRISYAVRGDFTSRMESELKAGARVWVKLPYGEFVVHQAESVVLFAGGTGITAFTAFLEEIEDRPAEQITLFYGARCLELLLYRQLIDRAAGNHPQFTAWYFLERPPSDPAAIQAQIGQLAVAAAWPNISRPSTAHYYLSGPPAMLSSLTQQLERAQIDPGKIHLDAWE
jgi:ferredoxin-NADP reductase